MQTDDQEKNISLFVFQENKKCAFFLTYCYIFMFNVSYFGTASYTY